MDALNGMAVVISGLAFAGVTALTAVTAGPASAQAALSTPYMTSANWNGIDGRGDGIDDNSQVIDQDNDCGNGINEGPVFCQNLASQIQGAKNSVTQAAEQEEEQPEE